MPAISPFVYNNIFFNGTVVSIDYEYTDFLNRSSYNDNDDDFILAGS